MITKIECQNGQELETHLEDLLEQGVSWNVIKIVPIHYERYGYPAMPCTIYWILYPRTKEEKCQETELTKKRRTKGS